MTEHVHDLFRRLADAMNARRLDELDELLTPDFVRHCEATPDVVVHSPADFADFLRANAESFPDNVQSFDQVVVEGDRAGFWASYTGTQDGPLGPFPASGRQVRFSFGGTARIRDGRIAELWVTWDNMALLGALGHLPAPEPAS
ncbi:ester cyclase [Pseudonocardia pini]|uniref:ester cyclase n=1 Tax=Pseudonocardia pini TaxID=2758030 RepID=UPI0015F10BD7|nr:ester cyclase [Pseudonocardia pini]